MLKFNFISTFFAVASVAAMIDAAPSKLVRVEGSNVVRRSMLRAAASGHTNDGRSMLDALEESEIQPDQDLSMSVPHLSTKIDYHLGLEIVTSTYPFTSIDTPVVIDTPMSMSMSMPTSSPMSMSMSMSMGSPADDFQTSISTQGDDEFYGAEPMVCDDTEANELKVAIVVEMAQDDFDLLKGVFSGILTDSLGRSFETCAKVDDNLNTGRLPLLPSKVYFPGGHPGRSLNGVFDIDGIIEKPAVLNTNNVKVVAPSYDYSCTPRFRRARSCGVVNVEVLVYGDNVALDSVLAEMGRIFSYDELFSNQCSTIGVVGVRLANEINPKSVDIESERKNDSNISDKNDGDRVIFIESDDEDEHDNDMESSSSDSGEMDEETKTDKNEDFKNIIFASLFFLAFIIVAYSALSCCMFLSKKNGWGDDRSGTSVV